VFRAVLRLASPAAVLISAVAVTACVVPAGAANPSGSPAAAKDDVVIRVDWEGGFVPPTVNLSRLPLVLVTADGRVITQGPQIDIWPGPLMPNLEVRTLTPEALADLLELARDTGLLGDAQYELPTVADAPDTVLRITVDGTTFTVRATGLTEAPDDGAGLPTADRDGRAALRSFIDALMGLPDAAFTGPGAPYVADGLRVLVTPFVPSPDADWMAVEWPLADLGAAPLVGGADLGIRCTLVDGDDLATLVPLLATANQATPFRSGGVDYTLTVRPLLPGETGC
jgi:hypothetical protein